MSNAGIQYFFTTLGFPEDSWKVFYDFQPSGNIIPSLSGANSLYSGIPSMSTTGTFSGQNVQISHADDLNSTDWSMMWVFGKNPNSYGTLFSNYEGEQTKSGFTIGITSNNRLYLETSNQINPIFYESSVDLASQNAIFVNKLSNRLEFSYFDFNSKNVLTDSFSVPENSFLPSDNWYIGNTVNPPDYFSGQAFEGQIEKFLYLTGIIFPPQKTSLFSGLTLLRAPEYIRDLLQESSSYSYLNLTGEISNITFDIINNPNYFVQTGYLFDNTGLLEGKISGIVNAGSGYGTGYISGYLTQPSGVLVNNTGYVSGFSGYSEVGVGLRVFQSTIPSGASQHFISFPDPFSSDPVVFTELQNPPTFLHRQISNVSSSGFSILFSPSISSTGVILTTTAALTQTDKDLKLFKANIPVDSENFYINFPFDPISNPKIFSQIENPEEGFLSYGISEVSSTGFNVNFSGRVEFPGAVLHVLTTNLGVEDSFQILSTPLTSGTNSQFIGYTPPFLQPPIVFGQMTNSSGENIALHKISGVSVSGFYALFNQNLISNNYIFNSLAWSGTQSGVLYASVSGEQQIYIGQITDESANIYNLSGYKDVMITTQSNVPLYKSNYFTGITGESHIEIVYNLLPLYINVGHQLSLGTGEYAVYTHTINYQNNGNNLITANHILNYSGAHIQPDSFTVFKNSYQIFGYGLEDFTYDTDYIYRFGMEGVRYLNDSDNEGISELYIFQTGNNKVNVNLSAIFDRSSEEFFLDNPYQNTDVNLYLNGLGLFGGGHRIISYIPLVLELDGDYTMSGNYAFMNSFTEEIDRLIYDKIQKNRRYRYVPQNYISGSGTVFLNNFEVSQYGLYLNGVKLLSGEDYTTSGETVNIIDTELNGVSGRMFILPLDQDNKTRYTGLFEYLETPKFAKNTSMLWSNGIRQDLGNQYIETAKISLLTGSKTRVVGYPLIFNENSLFWR